MKNPKEIIAVLAALCVLIFMVFQTFSSYQKLSIVQRNYEILEDRIYKLEAHFIGNKMLVAHNGKGIDVVPCQLGKDENCRPESEGITVSNTNIVGWRIGINASGNGEKSIERPEGSGRLSLNHTDYEGVKGFSYEGPNDWHLTVALWWAKIKQYFSSKN